MADEKTTIELDVDFFTVGEVEDLEEATGYSLQGLARVLGSGDLPMKVLKALVWVVRRRSEPEFTLDDVRALRLSEIEFAGAAETDEPAEDPTPPPADAEAYAPA